jgi:hypothetical protein
MEVHKTFIRFYVDGREIYKASINLNETAEIFHIGVNAIAKKNIPDGVHVRFDNITVESLSE